MNIPRIEKLVFLSIGLFIFFLIPNSDGARGLQKNMFSMQSLLPEIDSWQMSESPQTFFPETLFEYIDGAAEIYLSYDFKELIVGTYQREGEVTSLIIEIYNMGNKLNSFGIYSAERFPLSQFISIGSQGYLDEGSLNFIVGRYYIKLLCFYCDEKSERILKLFAQDIVKRVEDKGGLPPLLDMFPGNGLVHNSEKYILRNFMGYAFLKKGYVANYKIEEFDFDCFIIEGDNESDAQSMVKQYLGTREEGTIREISSGYRIKDRYYQNIYIAQVRNYLCGVKNIKDGFEDVGEKYLSHLVRALE